MKRLALLFILITTLITIPLYAQNPVLVENQKLTIPNLGGNNYTIGSTAELRVTTPITNNGTVNFTSDSGWLILDGIIPSEAIASYFSYITVNGQPAVNKVNIRVTNYLRGCVVMPHSPTYEALTLFKDSNYGGDMMKCIPYKYYKIADLGSFDNTVSSFKLKKGYMATFAQNENGTGFSKVFIAESNDISISTMQLGLNDKVSFVRIFPWRYSEKKGFASGLPDFNRTIIPVKLTKSGWFYHWGTNTAEDLTDVEFVSTRWNATSLTDSRWKEILDIDYGNHLLGFNEPDGDTQANMTLDQMLLYWPKMLESGMRLGSPAMASDLNLLYAFIDKCDELNYRVDFVAMHDYGTGTAQQFYDKCKRIHDRTGRPIWIKEFNLGGTWVRGNFTYQQVSDRIALIMDKYDTEGIIERYSIFNFDQTVNDFGQVQNRAVFVTPAMPNYTFTPLGDVYRNNVSPMAFNPAEAIDVALKLVAPQNLKITNKSGTTLNKLVWENFNFTGLGTILVERKSGAGNYIPIEQLSIDKTSYDDISAVGFVKHEYRLSVSHTGLENSKFVTGSIDLDQNIIFNVALNKPATASSILSATEPASDAVDGNSTDASSRWVNARGAVPAFLEIDLQASFLISEIKIFTGLQSANNPLTSFTFDYWNDSTQNWTSIITETNNSLSNYSKSFAEVRTNKVRLNINGAAPDNTIRLFELEVYGKVGSNLAANDYVFNDFKIHPNPTSNLLFLTGNTAIESSEIFDTNGKKLITKNGESTIDVSNLSAGIYFIKINNTETFKFIKK